MLNQKVLNMTLDHNRFRTKKRQKFHRVVKLKTAEWTLSGMPSPKAKDLSSSQRRGKAFERKALKEIRKLALPGLIIFDETKEWIKYVDSTGFHLAQPDGIDLGKIIYLFECKLTQNDNAHAQMKHLYTPLLRHIYNPQEVVHIQVCKNLQYRTPKMLNMEDLCQRTIRKPGPWLLHLPLL